MLYHKPSTFTRWMNRTLSWLASLGLTPSDTVAIKVRGRKSGKLRANVVTTVDVDGQRYLVSPRGNSEWVRNVRASDGEAFIGRRGTRRVRLEEVPAGQRAAIIKPYLKKTATATKAHFGVDPDAPIEEFQRIAPDHPVFRIVDAGTS